jgi:simple sugar transport system permease protein/ribose transport system permease protein
MRMTADQGPTSGAPGQAEGQAWGARSARDYVVPAVSGIGLVALFIFGATATPGFLGVDNLLNIIRAAAIIGTVALGMTFITISGNFFSLSVAQTAAFAAVMFAGMMRAEIPIGLTILAVLAFAVGVGVIQGAFVGRGANPIITTLGAGAVLFGLTALVTDNRTINIGSDVAEWLGRGRPLGVPNQTWLFLILTLVGTIILSRTRLGRQMYLVGANRAAARASGISILGATLFAFAASAVTAALVGIMAAAQFSQGSTTQFVDLTIPVVAAVLVGGTAIAGGQGSMLRTMLGAVFIALLQNIMLLRGIETGWRLLLTGTIVAVAVSLYALARGRGR